MNKDLPAARTRFFAGYTFVDYATQAYQGLVCALVGAFHNATTPHWRWVVIAHVFGMLITHCFVVWHAQATRNRFVSFLRHFYPVLFYVWFFTETGRINRMFFAYYLDPALIRWEETLLGFQPSVVFMERLPFIWVSEAFYASYFSYYVMIFGVGLALYLRSKAQFFHYISVVSFVFYVCYTLYIALPVIGPRVFFREVHGYSLPDELQAHAPAETYPHAVKAGAFFKIMAWIYATFESPGAAMPSSHVAIALTTVYFSFRYLPRIRFIHAFVAAMLCLSTIYCRYHYALDVVAGAAAMAALVPLGNWLFARFNIRADQQVPAVTP